MMVVVCPEHGDLWRAPGKKPGDLADHVGVEVCQEGVPSAVSHSRVECPWCGRDLFSGLRQEHRPD